MKLAPILLTVFVTLFAGSYATANDIPNAPSVVTSKEAQSKCEWAAPELKDSETLDANGSIRIEKYLVWNGSCSVAKNHAVVVWVASALTGPLPEMTQAEAAAAARNYRPSENEIVQSARAQFVGGKWAIRVDSLLQETYQDNPATHRRVSLKWFSNGRRWHMGCSAFELVPRPTTPEAVAFCGRLVSTLTFL
jgi:hypothetical protein